MAKPLSKTSPVKVVVPGQPSELLVAALRETGAKVTTKHLAEAIAHLEAARVGFVCEAIATGTLLLARKQTLKHGEWQKLCAEIWREMGNGKRVSHSSDPEQLHNFTRSLRSYTFLAQHFLADLEQGNFRPETQDQKVLPPAVKPTEVLALDTLSQEQRLAVYQAISAFVAGRSLRRMLIDFRRAESAADQEEIDEASRRRKPKGSDDDGGGGGGSGQLDFWADMQRPLDQIESLFTQKSFVERTDKQFWLRTAAALEAQAKRARALAKEIA